MPARGAYSSEERRTIRSYYRAEADAYAAAWAPVLASFAAPLFDAIGIRPDDRVLDIGCGTGTALRERMGGSALAAGLDLTVEMLSHARAPGTRLVAGDATALPFRERSFDVALSNFVLHHFRAQQAALREARRVLSARGRMGITVWGRGAMDSPAFLAWDGLLDRFGAPADPEPPRSWERLHDTPEKARRLLERAGFGDVRAWSETRTHDAGAGAFVLHAKRIGAPARRLAALSPERRESFLEEATRAMSALPRGAFTWRGETVYALGCAR